jgi:hypothetical protein
MTLRWPFVSREVHDAQVTMLRELLIGSKAEYLKACERYDALLGEHRAYVAEIAGLTRPTQVPVAVPRPKREPDQADTAIDFVARDNYPMKRELERYAKTERAKGTEPEKIAAEILAMVRPKPADEEEGFAG